MITTQAQPRKEFWKEHPTLKRVPGKTQNQYPTDTRVAWCDFVENMRRSQMISEKLAIKATL